MLAISNFKNKEIQISKALADSNISHYEFVLINSMLKEHYDIKEEIKKFRLKQFSLDFSPFIKQCYCINWSVEKMQKRKTQMLWKQ